MGCETRPGGLFKTMTPESTYSNVLDHCEARCMIWILVETVGVLDHRPGHRRIATREVTSRRHAFLLLPSCTYQLYSCAMGIKGLTGLLSEHAPQSIKEHDIKTLFGRKVAIDASMSMYQFLIAVRQKDGELLTNDAGETTSHLMGFFYRTIRIVENGIKPAYVFDGKPPELKKGVVSSFQRDSEAARTRNNPRNSSLNGLKSELRRRRRVKRQRK